MARAKFDIEKNGGGGAINDRLFALKYFCGGELSSRHSKKIYE